MSKNYLSEYTGAKKKLIRVRPVIRVRVNVGKRTNHLSRRALP